MIVGGKHLYGAHVGSILRPPSFRELILGFLVALSVPWHGGLASPKDSGPKDKFPCIFSPIPSRGSSANGCFCSWALGTKG